MQGGSADPPCRLPLAHATRVSTARRLSTARTPHRAPPPRLFRVLHLPRSSGFQPESRSEADADLRPCGRRLGLEAASAPASPPHLRPAHTTRNPQAELRDEEERMTPPHRAPRSYPRYAGATCLTRRRMPYRHTSRLHDGPSTALHTATRDTPVAHAPRVCARRIATRLDRMTAPHRAPPPRLFRVPHLRRVARASSPSREAKQTQTCAHVVADSGWKLRRRLRHLRTCGPRTRRATRRPSYATRRSA